MRELGGKTALVTGAARGIGRAIALRLARAQMSVAVADRDVAGLAATCRSIEKQGGQVFALPCDLSDSQQIDRLVDDLLEKSAGVDLLVNNAGIAHYGPTHEMSPTETDRLLAVNLHAPIQLTQGLLPAMLVRPEAHILNVSSVLGLAVMPRVSAYCATKHALVGFSEALRVEYGRAGLGVTTLCPGFVRTELIDEANLAHQGQTIRRPPALFCVSVDRVAAAAVRGVQRNRRRIVIDPAGRVVRTAMMIMPDAFDWMHSFGRWKRVAKKRARLRALHDDPHIAIRMQLGLVDPATAPDALPLAA